MARAKSAKLMALSVQKQKIKTKLNFKKQCREREGKTRR